MICPRCESKMYLDQDEQSLVCSNILCLHRDYRISCPLIEYINKQKYFKTPSDKMHLIVCTRCGVKSYTKVENTTLCYNCRGYHYKKAKERAAQMQMQAQDAQI